MPLIIIESPNKVKKFREYTGFKVMATGGHFRDLPDGAINVDMETYEPLFAVMPKKEKLPEQLKKAAKGEVVFLATDPDREGEAISHHVHEVIRGLYKEAYRIEVREITKGGIKEALSKAVPFADRSIGAYNAFLGRRVADRLVGFILSPRASRGMRVKGMSIGRVQTVALRLVVEKERDIRDHAAKPYWLVAIEVAKDGQEFLAYHTVGRIDDRSVADGIISKVARASYASVRSVERQSKKSNPKPPFTTASLQMAASSQLGISPGKAMDLAQALFEAGLISYHRTDSVRLADDIIENIRTLVTAEYGKDCVPEKPVKHTSKASQADAHEGIRPTAILPLANAKKLLAAEGLASEDHLALYELIWKRTVASQMSSAIYELTTVILEAEREIFKGVGRVLAFDGFKRVYGAEEEEEKKGEGEDQELPPLGEGDLLAFRQEILIEKKTKASPRYSEAGLIEKLESLGIGRPSTYASILGAITKRGYVESRKRMLVPTEKGEKLFDWAEQNCTWVVDYDMTREMEDVLDAVEEGEVDWHEFAREIHGKMGDGKQVAPVAGPTPNQIEYAGKIAHATGSEIPEVVLTDRKKLSEWIDSNRPERTQGQLSPKQLQIIQKHAPEEVRQQVAGGDYQSGKQFVDDYFRRKERA